MTKLIDAVTTAQKETKEKNPEFKSVVKSHMTQSESWRFPKANIHSKDTIICYSCDTTIVEVIKIDEEAKEIENLIDYPVYIKEHIHTLSGGKQYCEKCYKAKVMTNQECDYCYDPIFYAKHKGARFHKNCPDNNPLPRSESYE